MFIIFTVLYILIAAAMIVLILMQRGEGADAGAGFGGGSSATVFGARGAASFLTRSTAILGTLFFVISLGMGIYVSRSGAPTAKSSQDLGVMANAPTRTVPKSATTTGSGVVPKASSTPAAAAKATSGKKPASAVPTATAPVSSASSGSGKGS